VLEKFLTKVLTEIHLPRWLEILLGVVFLFRTPSFLEPYYYGDEMIYLTLGEGIRRGVTLYQGIHDNKPPLLYLLAAASGNLFWFKAILTFWVLLTIVFFWKLSRHFFENNERVQKIATVTFAILTTLPLLEGNIVNAELFLIGPIIGALLILLSRKPSFKNLFCAGILFAIATLFKVPAAFEVPVILVYWIIIGGINKKNLLASAKKFGVVLLGFTTPILLSFAWLALQGALGDYLRAAFLQNVGYISSWRPVDIQKPFLLRNLPLFIRSGVVALGILIVWFQKKRLSTQFIFITLWVLFSLFAVTLSERPYPHYLIQTLPALSLLVGILVASKTVEQAFAIIPLALALFVPVYYKYYYYNTFTYYTRFANFALGRTDKVAYFAGFDQYTNRNYEIAEFLKSSTKKSDRVFVWGDASPAIYALSRRLPPLKYTAAYHVLDYSTREALISTLEENQPQVIVLLPESPALPEIIPFLNQKYLPLHTIDNAQLWYKQSLPLGEKQSLPIPTQEAL
jgi:hypothetical protein